MLTTQEREAVSAAFQRAGLCPSDHLKAMLLAVVDAVDDWVEANQASYNSALPLAFRTGATAEVKALMMFYVVMKRVGRG